MPNGYAVVPNILPGNVSIGGNLTVGGDQLRIGAAAPFARVGKAAGGEIILNGNIAFDGVTRDDPAKFGTSLNYNLVTGGIACNRLNAAGNLNFGAIPLPMFTDYTTHGHTGTVTQDTIYSKLIRGGIIGANGGLLLRVLLRSLVQGAAPSGITVFLGAGLVGSWSFAAAGTFLLQLVMANQNNQAVQIAYASAQSIAGAVPSGGTATPAIDTSVDQTLTVRIQNGAATDNQNFDVCTAELLNSFGPV